MKVWLKPNSGLASGTSALMALALLAVLLAGCMTTNGGKDAQASAHGDIADLIREVDLTPPRPAPVQAGTLTGSRSEPRAATYNGDGSIATAGAQPGAGANRLEPDRTPTGSLPRLASLSDGATQGNSKKGYEINFENNTTKHVLGYFLVVCSRVDRGGKGPVSFSSGRAVPKRDLLFVLESALRMSNVALVLGPQGYLLLPTTEELAAGLDDWGN